MIIPTKRLLASSQFESVSLRQAAEHPFTPSHVLHKLAKSKDITVRTAVADHANTSIETILFLTKDHSEDLRYALAENHNLDIQALKILSEDENPYVSHRAKKTLARLEGGTVLSGNFAPMQAVPKPQRYQG